MTLSEIGSIVNFPEIPSKYDIIPIHNSDRASFKRCRRYWHWTSPAHSNLAIRADILGINTDLWFGTGIHYALEQFYQPGLRRDPVETWKTWFDIQWRGGIVTEDWLDLVYDLNPRPVPQPMRGEQYIEKVDGQWVDVTPQTWLVRGLEDILPDPDSTEFDELFELGIHMMEFYKQYSAKHDDFEVIVAEHTFSVPIWDFKNDCIFTAIDRREESPNYGKELEVHARGRQDCIYARESISGTLVFGVIDHKTASKIGDEFFRKLEADEQSTTYLWAAEVEAKYYNLPYANQQMEEVVFQALRKKYPKPPTELKNGTFSVNREEESCTYEMLKDWIARNMPGVQLTEKQQGYVDWLREVGDEQFVVRFPARRNRHQITNAGKRIYQEAVEMLNPDLEIYPNISNDFRCINCAFRAPCLAVEDGGDYNQLLGDNYAVARDR